MYDPEYKRFFNADRGVPKDALLNFDDFKVEAWNIYKEVQMPAITLDFNNSDTNGDALLDF